MFRVLFLAAFLQCSISQQHEKTAPGVPPQNYQNYEQPPPPPPPQQQQYQQPQQQQYQHPALQEFQQPQQVDMEQQQVPIQQQQIPVQQQQILVQQQQIPVQQQQQIPVQQQQQVPVQQGEHGQENPGDMLNPGNIEHERKHIQEHMEVPIDTSKMSDQELQFHYFKMHDADNNTKLDGCELIKWLIHWHEHNSKNQQPEGTAPTELMVYGDEKLVSLIDPVLEKDDDNNDGYIDYPEFVRTQQKSQALLAELHQSKAQNDQL